jgi:hypothetical protein
MRPLALALAAASLVIPFASLAWGNEDHEIIAAIAPLRRQPFFA